MAKFTAYRDPERRRSPRFPWEMEVVLGLGEGGYRCLTFDVSLYGIYVHADRLVETDRIIQVRVPQGADNPIEWVGIVRRVVSAREATVEYPQGMGLEIFAADDAHWSRWSWLIATVADQCEARFGPDQRRDSGARPAVTPRQHARHRVPVEVKLGSMPELIRFGARDISAGGIFLSPAPPLAIGDEVALSLRHPLSGATFQLEGRVVRVESDGAAMEFVNLTEATRDTLKRFIVTGKRPG